MNTSTANLTADLLNQRPVAQGFNPTTPAGLKGALYTRVEVAPHTTDLEDVAYSVLSAINKHHDYLATAPIIVQFTGQGMNALVGLVITAGDDALHLAVVELESAPFHPVKESARPLAVCGCFTYMLDRWLTYPFQRESVKLLASVIGKYCKN